MPVGLSTHSATSGVGTSSDDVLCPLTSVTIAARHRDGNACEPSGPGGVPWLT